MNKRIIISGKIDLGAIDKIRENLETFQNENVQEVDIFVENAFADRFDLIARLVESLNDSSIKKEIYAKSELSLTGIAILSTTNVGKRNGYEYYNFNFHMPDAIEGMVDNDLDKLAKKYVLLLKKLLKKAKSGDEKKNSDKKEKIFDQETLVRYLKEGSSITYEKAVELGILRGYRKSKEESGDKNDRNTSADKDENQKLTSI